MIVEFTAGVGVFVGAPSSDWFNFPAGSWFISSLSVRFVACGFCSYLVRFKSRGYNNTGLSTGILPLLLFPLSADLRYASCSALTICSLWLLMVEALLPFRRRVVSIRLFMLPNSPTPGDQDWFRRPLFNSKKTSQKILRWTAIRKKNTIALSSVLFHSLFWLHFVDNIFCFSPVLILGYKRKKKLQNVSSQLWEVGARFMSSFFWAAVYWQSAFKTTVHTEPCFFFSFVLGRMRERNMLHGLECSFKTKKNCKKWKWCRL